MQTRQLNLYTYLLEDSYARVPQMTGRNNGLSDINEAGCRALAYYFRNYNYDCACGIMMVYFLSTISLGGTIYATTVHIVSRIRF